MIGIAEIGLDSLIDRYDCVFVDQFGVLRGAEQVYDGAREALAALREAGRTVIVLSNSGRSGEANAVRLEGLGIGPDLYTAFVTSGDAALDLLQGPSPPIRLEAGAGCYLVSSGDGAELPGRLGLRIVDEAAEADIVLIAGSEAERVPLPVYRERLRPAVQRGLVAICTNPDLQKLTAQGLVPAAGAIAREYEALGGSVVRVGKPYQAIYELALRQAGLPDRTRIVAIGDSLHHDVQGARGFGIDSVLVGTGIIEGLDDAALAALMAEAGCRPTWWMPRGFRPG